MQARDSFLEFLSMPHNLVHPHDYLYRQYDQIHRVQYSVKLHPPPAQYLQPFLQTLNDSVSQCIMRQRPTTYQAAPLNLSRPTPIVPNPVVASNFSAFSPAPTSQIS